MRREKGDVGGRNNEGIKNVCAVRLPIGGRSHSRIGSDELLIKVLGCGICAGDVKTLHGGQRVWGTSPRNAYIEAPCIGGHEFYGEVAEVGENITGVKIGQKILAEQILPCGECKFCREGNYWMCQPHHIYGFKEDAQGGFAEYMKFAKTVWFIFCRTILLRNRRL